MADCDPQLTQDQRVEGFTQQAAVPRAIRPITLNIPASSQNDPFAKALASLVDYLNREVLPVVQPMRNRVNESYPAVQRNAPSANPLTHLMDPSTDASCPAAGFARLNGTPQSSSTVLRLSNSSQYLQNITPWTTLMANSATSPLGVVTVSDAYNPDNYIRSDLNGITDGGTCQELAITPFEASGDNPLGPDRPVVVSFIPGVAGAGVAEIAPGALPDGWSAVLAIGNHSGAHTPIIDSGSALSFASGSVGVSALGNLLLNVAGNFELETNLTSRLKVDSTGAWNLAGTDPGTSGKVITSAGPGAPPTWATVTVGALAAVASDTFIGNVSGSTASPSAVNLSTLAGAGLSFGTHTLDVAVGTSLVIVSDQVVRAALTGDVTSAQNSNITAFRSFAAKSVLTNNTNASAVPSDLAGTAALQYFRINSANTATEWGSFTLASLPTQATDTFLGNISGSTAVPSAVNLSSIASTSLAYDGTSHTFQRAALAGDVTATQNSNSTTIANSAVTNPKLANVGTDTFKGNISGSTAAPADVLLVSLASATIAYDNITTHTFQRAALTGDVTASNNSNATTIANSAVTNAKMANMVTDTFKGNIGGTTTAPSDVLLSSIDSTSIIYDGTSHTFQRAALTGDVTSSQNSNALAIAANAVTTTAIANSAVTNAKLANMAADTVKCNASGVSAAPGDLAINAQGVVGRTSGDLQSIDSSVQTALIRGSGSVFWGAAAANQYLGRSGSGDLGFGSVPLTALATQAANTFVANNTAGTAAPTAITVAAATAALNAVTSSLQGMAPASGGGTTNFLRADATWAAPTSSLPSIATDTVLGNVSGSTATAAAVSLTAMGSTSVNYSAASHTFLRAALTGEVTAASNSNATTIDKTISPTWTGTHTFNGVAVFGSNIRKNAAIFAAAITTQQNNYNPSGFSTANVVVLQATGATQNISGFVAGSAGETKLLFNQGTQVIDLLNLNTSSTAGNRIACPGSTNYGLVSNNGIGMWYDGTNSAWRLFGT